MGCSSTITARRPEVAEPIEPAGFYWSGLLCLFLAVLKLTLEAHWSWWRVLMPFWALLGHNILYIIVGFVWLSFADDGVTDEEITIRQGHGEYAYQVTALVCFLIFADNLLARIEGTEETTWFGLRSGWWTVIVASGVLSVVCQLLFWSTVVPADSRRTWEE